MNAKKSKLLRKLARDKMDKVQMPVTKMWLREIKRNYNAKNRIERGVI